MLGFTSISQGPLSSLPNVSVGISSVSSQSSVASLKVYKTFGLTALVVAALAGQVSVAHSEVLLGRSSALSTSNILSAKSIPSISSTYFVGGLKASTQHSISAVQITPAISSTGVRGSENDNITKVSATYSTRNVLSYNNNGLQGVHSASNPFQPGHLLNVPIPKLSISTTAGLVSKTRNNTLSSISSNIFYAAVTPIKVVALHGASATFNVGNISFAKAFPISGVSRSSSVGSLNKTSSRNLVSSSSTAQLGSLTKYRTASITGVSFSSTVRGVVNNTILPLDLFNASWSTSNVFSVTALTGVSRALSVRSTSPARGVALTPVNNTASVSSIGVRGIDNNTITNVSSAWLARTFNKTVVVHVAGVSSSLAANGVTSNRSEGLSKVSTSAAVTSLSKVSAPRLTSTTYTSHVISVLPSQKITGDTMVTWSDGVTPIRYVGVSKITSTLSNRSLGHTATALPIPTQLVSSIASVSVQKSAAVSFNHGTFSLGALRPSIVKASTGTTYSTNVRSVGSVTAASPSKGVGSYSIKNIYSSQKISSNVVSSSVRSTSSSITVSVTPVYATCLHTNIGVTGVDDNTVTYANSSSIVNSCGKYSNVSLTSIGKTYTLNKPVPVKSVAIHGNSATYTLRSVQNNLQRNLSSFNVAYSTGYTTAGGAVTSISSSTSVRPTNNALAVGLSAVHIVSSVSTIGISGSDSDTLSANYSSNILPVVPTNRVVTANNATSMSTAVGSLTAAISITHASLTVATSAGVIKLYNMVDLTEVIILPNVSSLGKQTALDVLTTTPSIIQAGTIHSDILKGISPSTSIGTTAGSTASENISIPLHGAALSASLRSLVVSNYVERNTYAVNSSIYTQNVHPVLSPAYAGNTLYTFPSSVISAATVTGAHSTASVGTATSNKSVGLSSVHSSYLVKSLWVMGGDASTLHKITEYTYAVSPTITLVKSVSGVVGNNSLGTLIAGVSTLVDAKSVNTTVSTVVTSSASLVHSISSQVLAGDVLTSREVNGVFSSGTTGNIRSAYSVRLSGTSSVSAVGDISTAIQVVAAGESSALLGGRISSSTSDMIGSIAVGYVVSYTGLTAVLGPNLTGTSAGATPGEIIEERSTPLSKVLVSYSAGTMSKEYVLNPVYMNVTASNTLPEVSTSISGVQYTGAVVSLNTTESMFRSIQGVSAVSTVGSCSKSIAVGLLGVASEIYPITISTEVNVDTNVVVSSSNVSSTSEVTCGVSFSGNSLVSTTDLVSVPHVPSSAFASYSVSNVNTRIDSAVAGIELIAYPTNLNISGGDTDTLKPNNSIGAAGDVGHQSISCELSPITFTSVAYSPVADIPRSLTSVYSISNAYGEVLVSSTGGLYGAVSGSSAYSPGKATQTVLSADYLLYTAGDPYSGIAGVLSVANGTMFTDTLLPVTESLNARLSPTQMICTAAELFAWAIDNTVDSVTKGSTNTNASYISAKDTTQLQTPIFTDKPSNVPTSVADPEVTVAVDPITNSNVKGATTIADPILSKPDPAVVTFTDMNSISVAVVSGNSVSAKVNNK